MIPSFIARSQIPHKPGIYIYKDKTGEVIYVGKAIDLYSRVSSYFNGRASDTKTMHLVHEISDIETIVVESEIEALILEANLIKKFLPTFNIRLTDDKDYLYIGITSENFPKVITVRKHDLKTLKSWFGPFPSSTTVKQTLKQLRKVFPWCSNPPGVRNNADKPCFYYHIKLCPGACVGATSEEDYNKIINRFRKFMEGKKEELKEELTKEMEDYANNQEYEQADRIKKILTGIEYITAPTKITQYLANPNFVEDINRKALLELQQVLNLPQLPERIEAYDISNIQGIDATGSMVVLTNGETDKSQYRKFKIKISGKPNDYAMHAEMMQRRLGHPEWGIPNLILIDGGRGQVRVVSNVINEIASSYKPPRNDVIASGAKQSLSKVPIYGIAKRLEWLYPPEGEVIKLPKRSLSLRLLQKIRDESHRFAITYHRKLRQKSFI